MGLWASDFERMNIRGCPKSIRIKSGASLVCVAGADYSDKVTSNFHNNYGIIRPLSRTFDLLFKLRIYAVGFVRP